MTFEELISSVGYGCDADIVLAKKAWDAAIEAAAKVVEERGAMIGGAIRPDKTAKGIRALCSNRLLDSSRISS